MAFRPGESIAGRYVVEDVIASGGMGVIYAARHLVLDERVAIKCLLPELSSDAEQTARLIGEARAAAKIRSEHVARIIDADRLPDGTVFLAMERLDGRDLGSVLEECRTLPVETAIAYVLQAGEALAEAHACGIVHRDLKPANLFAARRTDGSTCIKVLDFGISKVLPHEAQVRTRTGTFMGTPMYASPEQLTTPSDVDLRSDIWALGCVLYELITGEPPFVRDTIGALVAAIVSAPAGSVAVKRPDVPEAVDAAIARCLAKERDQRWHDIAELAVALGPFSPAQAAVSVPRILALATPSSATVPDIESGRSIAAHAAHVAHAAQTPASGSGGRLGSGSGTAFAPTVSVVPPAPASNAQTSPEPARRASTAAWWIAACVLAVALAGALFVRKRTLHTAAITSDGDTSGAAPAAVPAAVTAKPALLGDAAVGAADAGIPSAPATTAEGVGPAPRNGGLRAATPARSGARRVSGAPSSSGKSDDWNMHLKE